MWTSVLASSVSAAVFPSVPPGPMRLSTLPSALSQGPRSFPSARCLSLSCFYLNAVGEQELFDPGITELGNMSVSTQVKEGSQCWLVSQSRCRLVHTICKNTAVLGGGGANSSTW